MPDRILEMVPGDLAVWQAEGDLDAYSAAKAREELAALANYPRVVLDLSGVPFIDSAGLGAMVGGIRRIRDSGGAVAICTERATVNRLLHVVGLDAIVPLTDSLDEALEALPSPVAI